MSRMHGMVFATVLALVLAGFAGSAQAKGRKPAAAKPTPAPKVLNACGCYADLSGKCFCPRKAKCGCPGECEPRGCEEKRARQMQKEIAAETKKAAETDRKARLEEKKRAERPEPEPKPKDEKAKDEKAKDEAKPAAKASDSP
jgi:hypothetical protein